MVLKAKKGCSQQQQQLLLCKHLGPNTNHQRGKHRAQQTHAAQTRTDTHTRSNCSRSIMKHVHYMNRKADKQAIIHASSLIQWSVHYSHCLGADSVGRTTGHGETKKSVGHTDSSLIAHLIRADVDPHSLNEGSGKMLKSHRSQCQNLFGGIQAPRFSFFIQR